MLNSPADHVSSAQALSLSQNCAVVGVYNASQGVSVDLRQSVHDKLLRVHRIGGVGSSNREDAMERALWRNKAALSLFRLLRRCPKYRRAPVFAHSQGNLIVSNVLSAIAELDGARAVRGVEVNSYGSPCATWPAGIVHHNHAFTLDPIGLLSVGDPGWLTFANVKVGFVPAHGFLEYLKHDPEFVINRFRWGGCGITFSLDEAGLAKALIDMGPNAERVYRVFQRLYDAHNSDVDDVACLYVTGLRTAPQGMSVLRTLKQAQPRLIALLIRALAEGWTTKREKACIQALEAL